MAHITYEVRVHDNGTQIWFKDGQLHREDGPAVIYDDGSQFWYLNGQLHREDGPAVIYANGTQLWYIDDVNLTEDEFNRKMNPDPCDGKIVEIDGKKFKLVSVE